MKSMKATKNRVGGYSDATSFSFHTPREIQSPSQAQNVWEGQIYWRLAEIPR